MFQKEKCTLWDDPKFMRSNGWIKKSTFWPCLVRGLFLIAVKWIFKYCDLLICHPFVLYLFLPFLAWKLVILHIFQIFRIFGLYFDAWIGAGQNTVSTIGREVFLPGWSGFPLWKHILVFSSGLHIALYML